MSSKKDVEVPTRGLSRRQASLEAKRQIHQTSKRHAEAEPMEVSDDEVVEVTPKKKYKVIPKKPSDDRNVIVLSRLSEPTLNMECWSEPLSAAQITFRSKQTTEHKELTMIIESHLKKTNSEIIYQGTSVSAFHVTANTKTSQKTKGSSSQAAKIVAPSVASTSVEPARPPPVVSTPTSSAYSLVVDPRSGQVVGTVTPTGTTTCTPITPTTPITLNTSKKPQKLAANSALRAAVSAPPLVPVSNPPATPPTSNATPTQAVVDLTTEEMANGKSGTTGADSKEVSFNKLQGKTFPSLVVVAKPSLKSAPASGAADRVKLDHKVKQVLIYPPGKFTEFLIQQGLIKAEQTCGQHPGQKFKLGMYSDASKFPYSGGYVWLSECCAAKFVSVFHGSIFDVNPRPPSVTLKLIYHWACQTNIANVIQWVKVDNLFVKGMYTWMRAICTVGIHTHIPQMGGPGVKVEIGVISLGTTTQDGSHRNVKVEVLGILETETHRIRLRAIEPCPDNEKNSKRRFIRILEPLSAWLHPETTIVTDLTVDKITLHTMGFLNVVQHPQVGPGGNSQIMDYLRKVVPRMFQNTLSLLSRQIIQQFLDELVWREWFGITAADAYENIIRHLAEQTKAEPGASLANKLNKVAANPFKNWSIVSYLGKEAPRLFTETYKKKRKPQLSKPAANKDECDIPEKTVSLEPYYYGNIEGIDKNKTVIFAVKCPLCADVLTNNLTLMLHCFRHTSNADYFCKYCLVDCSSKHNLYTHVELKHSTDTKAGRFVNCLICNDKFTKTVMLGNHLSICHYPSELPYHCESCTHKTSNHKVAIDHFYKCHGGQSMLQCPYCLKSMNLVEDGKIVSAKVSGFLSHLQNHLKRTTGKGGRKCNRCELRFLYKSDAIKHLANHKSYKKRPDLKPWTSSAKPYVVPESTKYDDDDGEDTENRDLSNVIFGIPDNSVCKECNLTISSPKHFPNLLTCTKFSCKYSTCCENSMKRHELNCDSLRQSPGTFPLDAELYCSCGYRDIDGNRMADHLSNCERNSAYPTKEAAAAACATNNMLDSLGLVRKPEESTDKEEKKESIEMKIDKKRRMSDSSDEDAKASKQAKLEISASKNDAVEVINDDEPGEKDDDVVEIVTDDAENVDESVEAIDDVENVAESVEATDDVENVAERSVEATDDVENVAERSVEATDDVENVAERSVEATDDTENVAEIAEIEDKDDDNNDGEGNKSETLGESAGNKLETQGESEEDKIETQGETEEDKLETPVESIEDSTTKSDDLFDSILNEPNRDPDLCSVAENMPIDDVAPIPIEDIADEADIDKIVDAEMTDVSNL